MALRVLLADESSTIKKVIQLALQDYAVEVRAVPVGLDVLTVTKSFKPDLILADVLLPKRSGYEVSADLKRDPLTQKIPVILMWSGFMELDEKKTQASGANDRLEKPFETEQLRDLVKKWVPKVLENSVSNYLTFPALPDFEEDPRETPSIQLDSSGPHHFDFKQSTNLATHSTTSPQSSEFQFDQEPYEEFHQVPLHRANQNPVQSPQEDRRENWNPQTLPSPSSQEENWSKKDLTQFKIEIPKTQFEVVGEDLNPQGSFEEFVYNPEQPLEKIKEATRSSISPKTSTGIKVQPEISTSGLTESVIKEQIQKEVADAVWKILPEIAERVIREEIKKLLAEMDQKS